VERIHGSFIIRRRTTYTKKSTHTQYKPILVEDFHNMCGYCGKNFDVISAEPQIDHLIPVDFCKKHGHPELKSDYGNLVYSCRVCNRNKWNDWPTQDVDNCHNGDEGYVDPASEEFDNHLMRDQNGNIVPLTKVGEYMCKKFGFNHRLINICWLVVQLHTYLEQVAQKIETQDPDQDTLLKFYRLQTLFDKNIASLKKAKEML
jgi:hypothetical protein